MTHKTLVSVIIPFFNRQELTKRAILSVLNQTYQNIEIIVVDDGSKETIDEPSLFSLHQINLIRHSENKGANAARNTGIKNSKGEWIAFLDSDDTWELDKIELMMNMLVKNPVYSVCYCGINRVENGQKVGESSPSYSGDLYDQLLVKNIVGSASVPIIKKNVLEEVSGFDEQLESAQDWDLWLRIAEKGSLFLYLPQALVNYTMPTSNQHISGSEKVFWVGRKKFLEKHKPKYIGKYRKALGTVYSDIGFLFLTRFRNRVYAFKSFIEALKFNPKRKKSWLGLVGVFIPISFILKQPKNEV